MLHPEKPVVICVSSLGLNQHSESLCTVKKVVCPAGPPRIEFKHLIILLKWTKTHTQRHRPDGDPAFASTLLLLLVMARLVDIYHLKAGAVGL